MHQQKVTGRFKEVLEAAAMLVSSKVELIGERKALMLTKGRTRDSKIEMMTLLHTEHDCVTEHITETEVDLEYYIHFLESHLRRERTSKNSDTPDV